MKKKKQDQALIEILKDKNTLRQQVDEVRSVVDSNDSISIRDLSFIHIQELTFDDKFPQREAVENVISALRIDGIRFIYLLLGDKKGVSFYFGIAKDKQYGELELDVDEIAQKILKMNIEGNFRGSKTLVADNQFRKNLQRRIRSAKRFACMDGVPSVFEDSENFQGIDRLVDVMAGDEFGLMIIADPLANHEIQEIENTLYDISNKLAPQAKYSLQTSKGETKTDGSAVTKNDSEALGSSTGNNKGETGGTSSNVTKGISNTDNKSTSESAQEGKSKGWSKGTNTGNSKTKTIGSSESLNKSTATNTGESTTKEIQSKMVADWLSYIDEVLIKRLDHGRNKGLFHVGTYLFADQKGTLIKLGNTIQALFSGSDENKAPLKIRLVTSHQEKKAVQNLQLPKTKARFTDNEIMARVLFSKHSENIASWMSVKELSVIATLPQKEVVGLALKEEVEFGLNQTHNTTSDDDKVLLGNLVKSGNVLDLEISISKKILNKHTFICGVTGSGKTTTCQRILSSAQVPFMVIEPAKTEYRVLTEKYDDIAIFTLGNEKVAPFRLNPFEFFEGENISSRVDMIKANIEAAFDMEAAIPQIIEAALYRCYENYGWEIATSTNSKFDNPFADGVCAFPTLSDLIQQTKVVVEEQGFDDRLKNDYTGSIKARLQGLIIGAKGFMLDTPRSVDFKDLVERNVIIELEEIKSGSEKSLIMGFVLINLNEAVKIKHRENQSFKHITLIEEAHRLLSKYEPGDNLGKKLGVETFADMLAEVRKYGESLIIVDQIPNKLTPEVLKNTNTKIVHRLFASDDKEAIGNTMALKDEQKEFLSSLDVGRVIVSSQDFPRPIQVQIKELEDISTTEHKPIKAEKIRQTALEYYQQHYKTGIVFGLEAYSSPPELVVVEKHLMLPFKELEKQWQTLCKKGNTTGDFQIDITSKLKTFNNKNLLEMLAGYLYIRFYQTRKGAATQQQIFEFMHNILDGRKEFNRQEKAKFTLR